MKRAIKKATASESQYQDAARALGCVVCRYRFIASGGTHEEFEHCYSAHAGDTEIHHRNVGDLHGQKQLGQDAAVALCAYHHRGVPFFGWGDDEMREAYGPSFALHARDFREWTQDVLPGYGRGTAAWQKLQDEYLETSDGSE